MMPLEAGNDRGARSTLRRLLSTPMRWLSRAAREWADPGADAIHAAGESAAAASLKDKRVREVMRPRTEVVSVSVGASPEDARRLVREERYSRYPVYRESLDDMVGVFLAKDLWLHDDSTPFVLATHVRPVPYVPDSQSAVRVLEELRRARAHMAVVLDEYGGTAGIVTLEDLIEEVVGDINDEYDFARRPSIEANGVLELDAAMSLADARTGYGLDIPRGDWSTVGGFVFGELGRLARMGDRVPIATGELEVVAMHGRRVAAVRVHVRRTTPPGTQADREVPL